MAMIGPAPNARASWSKFEPTPPVATTATDSPARRSAPLRTAPYAVKMAQPRIAASSNGTSSGSGATPVWGMTAYSASPPIEYIQTGDPSGRRRRVSPSKSLPWRRLRTKNVSHRPSWPRTQYQQVPQGMMKPPTTR
jgi:hypothetical protein